MGVLSYLTGVGVPVLLGLACYAGALASQVYLTALVPFIGRALTVILCIAGTAEIAYSRGFESARLDCKEAAVRVDLEKTKMDLALSIKAGQIAAQQLIDQSTSEARNQELVDEIANLKRAPVPPSDAPVGAGPAPVSRDVCTGLTDADVGWLRRIKP